MATLTVGPTSTYPTIAAAMAAAIPGDTIALENGYSNETATVTVNLLIFNGAASSQNINLLLGSGVLGLVLTGNAPIAVSDNAANNAIVGNAGGNALTVTGGADTVDGLTGNDRLVVNYSSATLPVLSATLSAGTLDGSAGTFTDGLGGHTVTFDNIDSFDIRTGSAIDVITSGGGDDALNGGVGADTMAGGAGNDTYFVDNPGDVVLEIPGAGVDTVFSS
jgi:Ca2+-binding RTX toxin-like protein